MKKKLQDKKGFTLMEMLIVVAIIVILVAVSIPVFTGQLEKARSATDAANERAAKAAAISGYLTEELSAGTYEYDAASGELIDTAVDTATDKNYGKCTDHKGDFIKVTIGADGTVDVSWSNGGTLHDGDTD